MEVARVCRATSFRTAKPGAGGFPERIARFYAQDLAGLGDGTLPSEWRAVP